MYREDEHLLSGLVGLLVAIWVCRGWGQGCYKLAGCHQEWWERLWWIYDGRKERDYQMLIRMRKHKALFGDRSINNNGKGFKLNNYY